MRLQTKVWPRLLRELMLSWGSVLRARELYLPKSISCRNIHLELRKPNCGALILHHSKGSWCCYRLERSSLKAMTSAANNGMQAAMNSIDFRREIPLIKRRIASSNV